MGKAIVYCQLCGKSLYEDDFERGKASRIDNRPYCSACKAPAPAPPPPARLPPPPPPPPPAPRRAISDRIPVLRPPSTARLPKAPARRKPATALWGSLLFVGVASAIGLTLALAGRQPIPEPPPAVLDVPPTPRLKNAPDAGEKDLAKLRQLLAAPPAEWKREEIDVLLGSRPDLEGPRRDYARGILGLGLRDGLIGHWMLDEADGTVARDSSGRGNDGQIIGAPARVRGRLGGAFQFRGNDEDGVEIPSANELDTTESKSFSLCAWFLPERVPPGKEDKSNDAWYGLFIRAGMHVGLSYDRSSRVEMGHWLADKKMAQHRSADMIPPGSWTHVVGIVDTVAGRTRVFVNGRPSGETAWAPRSASNRLTSPWRLGIAAPKAKEWSWSLRGALDDVRFYARPLGAEEIALLAEGGALPVGAPAGRTPSDEGLVLHLKGDVAVTAEGTTVNAWGPARADGDERPSWKAVEGRTSIVFDGRNDRLVMAPLGELAFRETDSFTLLVKVHLDATVRGRWQGVFAKAPDPPPWFGIYIDDAGRWVFGSPQNLHGSPAKPGGSTVVAVQAGGRERRLYVDGLRVATGPPMDASGAGELWLGGVKGRGEHFHGAIQELRLWRRALDPSEVPAK